MSNVDSRHKIFQSRLPLVDWWLRGVEVPAAVVAVASVDSVSIFGMCMCSSLNMHQSTPRWSVALICIESPHSAVQFVPIWDERIAKICRLWKAWCYGWCLAQQDLECNWHSLITVDQWWTTWAKDIAKIKQQFILAHYESDRSRIEGKAAAAPFQPTASSALVPRIPDQPRSATEWHQKLFIH